MAGVLHLTCSRCNTTFNTVDSVTLHIQDQCLFTNSTNVFAFDDYVESSSSQRLTTAPTSNQNSFNRAVTGNCPSADNFWPTQLVTIERPTDVDLGPKCAAKNSSQGKCPYCCPDELTEGSSSYVCSSHRQWIIQDSDFNIGQGKNSLQVGTGLPQSKRLSIVPDDRPTYFRANASREAFQQNVNRSRDQSDDHNAGGVEDVPGPTVGSMTNTIHRHIIEYQKDDGTVASLLSVPSHGSQFHFPSLSRRVTTADNPIEDVQRDNQAILTFRIQENSDKVEKC